MTFKIDVELSELNCSRWRKKEILENNEKVGVWRDVESGYGRMLRG